MIELVFFLLGFNFCMYAFWLGDTRWGEKLTDFQFLKVSIVFIGLGSILFTSMHLYDFLQKHYNRVIANVLGLVAVGEFEKLLLKLPKKLIRSTQLNICTSAPIATNPC